MDLGQRLFGSGGGNHVEMPEGDILVVFVFEARGLVLIMPVVRDEAALIGNHMIGSHRPPGEFRRFGDAAALMEKTAHLDVESPADGVVADHKAPGAAYAGNSDMVLSGPGEIGKVHLHHGFAVELDRLLVAGYALIGTAQGNFALINACSGRFVDQLKGFPRPGAHRKFAERSLPEAEIGVFPPGVGEVSFLVDLDGPADLTAVVEYGRSMFAETGCHFDFLAVKHRFFQFQIGDVNQFGGARDLVASRRHGQRNPQ
ncbi:hypothetical protein SDC9_90619 [bioreactor metagenome]|uniref:Uncharacterized protein n=1 Tax=bioreactor metagenome TaxID=1076179 RepID=A0A644ZVL9_9ZZZZ